MAINRDLIRQTISNRDKGSAFWKPTLPKHIFRILPPKSEKLELPWVLVAAHYNMPLASGPLICGKTYSSFSGKLRGEGKCPICEIISKLYKSDSVEDMALLDKIKLSTYFYCNIVDKTDSTKKITSYKPEIYRFGKQVKEELENAFTVCKDATGKILSKEEMVEVAEEEISVDIVDITDLKKGNNLSITTGQKSFTNKAGSQVTIPEYKVIRAKNNSELLDAARIMKESIDLTTFLKEPDFKALESNAKALSNLNEDDADENIEIVDNDPFPLVTDVVEEFASSRD